MVSAEARTDPFAVDVDALRVGLSYVLHEPSSSSAVTEHVQLVLAQAKRASKALRQLSALPDHELLVRLVSRDDSTVESFQRARPSAVLSLRLGAYPLLGRVLSLILPTGAPIPTLHWLDAPSGDRKPRDMPLFAANAQLYWPDDRETTRWFAILVFRPGWSTFLLDLSVAAGEASVSQMQTTVERWLREYLDQWWVVHPWWDRPAEEVLPELLEEAR